jgi:Fur family transcriptional regulator, ferric uptake regulator
MKRHKDLLAVLRANDMRITSGRRVLLQFILDHHARRIGLREIHAHLESQMGRVDRTSVYRNLMAFQRLGIIQAFKAAKAGKTFQYALDRKVHPFYICKACGEARRGSPGLFERIQAALRGVEGFSRANLSVVFYGTCPACVR